MDRQDVERWLAGYDRAWRSNDPADVGALFTEDARYFTAPYRKPWGGRQGIVDGWLRRKDEPGTWEFRSEIVAVVGDLAFVRGWTKYSDGKNYSNLWVIRFGEDGAAREFTEWWMEERPPPPA
jgi:ketosteroid isomerase-like protein